MTLDNSKPSDGDIGGFFILENVVNVGKSKMEEGEDLCLGRIFVKLEVCF